MNARKILYFSIGPIGAGIFTIITLPIIAWLFTPDDIGRLSMLQVAVSFSILLFSLGLDQAYVREFHDVENKFELLKATLTPGLILLTIALVCLLLLPWSISELLFGIDSELLTGLLVVAILLQFFSRFLSLILRMQEKGLAYSMSQVLPKLLLLVILLLYVLFNIESVFKNLMIAQCLAYLAVFLIYIFNTKKDWMPALTIPVDRFKQKEMLKFGLPLIGSGLAFWGLNAMDKFFLRGFSSFQELGIYSVAISFASIALVFQAVFSTVWAPIVYKWTSEGVDPLKIKSVTDYSTLAVVTIWSLAGMFSWLVNYILPAKYEQIQFILLATMACPLLYTLSEATGVGIGVKRKTAYSMLAAFTALLLNGVGNWFLVPEYGAGGAAVASAIAFFAFFVVQTEASAMLWQNFERVRMYILIGILVIISILVNFILFNSFILFFMYFIILLVSIFIFNNQFISFLNLSLRFLQKMKPYRSN